MTTKPASVGGYRPSRKKTPRQTSALVFFSASATAEESDKRVGGTTGLVPGGQPVRKVSCSGSYPSRKDCRFLGFGPGKTNTTNFEKNEWSSSPEGSCPLRAGEA